MDTSSHILIGFGLAALAQADPVVSGSDSFNTGGYYWKCDWFKCT